MDSVDALPTIALGLDGWVLRAWREADAPSLARHANNANVWRWMHDGFPHPYTLEAAQQWVRHGSVDAGGRHWAITHDDDAVGGCGFTPMSGPERCNGEIGWWLGEDYWGRGVATRVARALIAQAFADPGLTRLFATVHAGNERSARVAEQAGLTLECLQRRSVYKAGRIIDRLIYATVKDA